jgi:hypothetical protein
VLCVFLLSIRLIVSLLAARLKVILETDMRKSLDTWTLSVEILMDCGNCFLETLNFSFICFLKPKCYGTFPFIIQYNHGAGWDALWQARLPKLAEAQEVRGAAT